MKYDHLLDVIGNTPMVRLNFPTKAKVYAKLEYLNPGGSVKDRTALYMIKQAERLGKLKPGGTIIEASSGNQGIAAAMIGAAKGYKVIITVSDKISKEKKDTLKAYGAELVICKPTTNLDDPEGYHTKAMAIHKATPNSFMLNQYFNIDNANAHYHSTGPEIWKQTEGKITHFIAATGSCGTIAGASKYLKEQNPNIKIIGVDTATSYHATKGNPQPYKLEGLGIDFDAPLLDESIIDHFINVTDDDAIAMLKTMARTYGYLIGVASGAVAHAVHEYVKDLPEDAIVVTLFTDSGRAYLTKGFYDYQETTTNPSIRPAQQQTLNFESKK